MKLSGSQIFIECLKEQGVDTIFGYPGGAILNLYDEIYKHQDEIKHILTSHEQGASHAADGYARSTGKVGVCLATSGPGATNLVTGIATAFMDSIPMVAFTGNVGEALLGKDSFQEIDIAGVTMPITKHNFIVKNVNDLAPTIRRAFEIAKSGRPGPVLVDITKNATDPNNKIDYVPVEPAKIERVKDTIKEEDIKVALKLISKAKKPVIFVGGGAVLSEASEELKEFVYKMDAPVCDTLMGKGAFSGKEDLYIGMLGMHGTKTANFSVSKCDLLVVIGSRFSDRITGNAKKFATNAKILQIDIDPAEINKNIIVDASVIGDIKEVLSVLNEKIEALDHTAWKEEVFVMRDSMPLVYNKDILTGPFVMEKLNEILGEDDIVTTEVGQHQMWAAQFYKYAKPRKLLTSGGLGTMGYGLGACIGAKVANPDKVCVNIAGDGCFRMNMNEICTATRYNIPIIEIILNNHVLGMVRQWQDLFYGQRYSFTTLNDQVDFAKVAEGMGAKTYVVTKPEEFEPAIKEAIELNVPTVIECRINSDDKVWPMVAPGTAISEAFDEKDAKEKLGK